jgi:hypothetical protein
MYLATVRGETRMLNLSNSSLAMRSSPQAGFSRAIRRMSDWSSLGIGGRPGRDFRRQNNRRPARCQRSSVAGFTTVKEPCQSNRLASSVRLIRVAASIRRGRTPRSMYSAN